MRGDLPKRPDGTDAQSRFVQWLWDRYSSDRQIMVSGQPMSRTTRGFHSVGGSGGSGSKTAVKSLILRNVRDDYLICRNVPTAPNDFNQGDPAIGNTPHWLGQFPDADEPAEPDNLDAYYNLTSHTFLIFSEADDEWITMTVDTTPIFVAKPFALRTSLSQERILGSDHDYHFTDGPSETWAAGASGAYNKLRTDTSSEVQRVVRPYVDGEIIFAISATTDVVLQLADDPNTDPDTPRTSVDLLEISPARQWAGPAT